MLSKRYYGTINILFVDKYHTAKTR